MVCFKIKPDFDNWTMITQKNALVLISIKVSRAKTSDVSNSQMIQKIYTYTHSELENLEKGLMNFHKFEII